MEYIRDKAPEIKISSIDDLQHVSVVLTSSSHQVYCYKFTVTTSQKPPAPITLNWRVPALNVKGVWKSSSLLSKRLQADWELEHLESRISVHAPVVALFGNSDINYLTFAALDATNKLEMNARIREEDGYVYCFIKFFTEVQQPFDTYETSLLLDLRAIHFGESLKEVSKWWEQNRYTALKAPPEAFLPVYSTWYSYHQDLSTEALLKECQLAANLGYGTIIVDDGWQTVDSNRGYDFTGDWNPERLPKMKEFVQSVQAVGMKFMMWYSVPFCGKKSKAYQQFRGKFLTENHRWAPVFDPRFPEVRAYLISKYVQAIGTWGMDGLKLDFIDDFMVYPETNMDPDPTRDFTSVNEAVDRLLTDVAQALQTIKPHVALEFRQKYIGPGMRQFGNMFRAFDCPHDGVTNRVRTTDVRLLAGSSATHSDMITWHYEEDVEVAALQVLNAMFSVLQISVRLAEIPEDHLAMIKFYTHYWLENQVTLMQGNFIPTDPLANYPLIRVDSEQKTVLGVYGNQVVGLDQRHYLDILNATLNHQLVYTCEQDFGNYQVQVYDCQGQLTLEEYRRLNPGVGSIEVPASGLIRLTKMN